MSIYNCFYVLANWWQIRLKCTISFLCFHKICLCPSLRFTLYKFIRNHHFVKYSIWCLHCTMIGSLTISSPNACNQFTNCFEWISLMGHAQITTHTVHHSFQSQLNKNELEIICIYFLKCVVKAKVEGTAFIELHTD